MAKTIDQLLTQSSLIANETKAGANTALRVGGMFSDILYHLRDSDYAQKSDIPTKVSSFENDANYATTSDLDARIDALVNGAPAAYDTLKEIADVLGKNVDSIADILDALGTKANKVDVDAAISAVNASISVLNTELSGKIDLKLDAATFNELFEKVLLEDGKTYAIRAKLGLYTDYFLSAKGANASGGSSTGGAGALYQLADVAADGQQVSGAATGALLMYNGTQWQGVSQSEIVPNLTGYAKLTDIPTTFAWDKVTGKPATLSGYGITDAYTSSQIDTKLGGYLPLSGGTITSSTFGALEIKRNTSSGHSGIKFLNNTEVLGILGIGGAGNAYFAYNPIFQDKNNNTYLLIHGGNIGSQSVASAAKLTTARSIWGQSFDGTGDVSGVLSGVTALKTDGDYGVWKGNLFSTALTTTDLAYNATKHIFYTGNVGIGTASPQYKLDVNGTLHASGSATIGGSLSNQVNHYIYDSEKANRLSMAWVNGLSCIYSLKADNSGYNDLRLGVTGNTSSQLYFDASESKWGIGTSAPEYKLDVNGEARVTKLVIGDGTIEWDAENKGFKVVGGLYSESYLSAKGANSSGSSTSGGLVESIWKKSDLGGTFGESDNDTFNAYAINSIHNRVSVLEGKATNVTYSQTQTSGTALGVITIDGASKTIYAPTIPTALKSPYALTFGSKTYDGSAAKTIVASDLGALTAHQTIYALTIKNSAGTTQLTYTPNSAVGSLTLTKAMVGLGSVENTALSTWKGTSNITTLGTITTGTWNGTKIANSYLANSAITIAGTSVSLGSSITAATLQSNLGLGALAYKGSLSFAELTGKPATLSGYGITDAYTASQIDTKLGGYLPLSGGTITSSTFGALEIKRNTSSGHSGIKFLNDTEVLGILGIGGAGNAYFAYNPIFQDKNNNTYLLIHGGNIGSQSVNYASGAGNADTLDELHASDFARYVAGATYDANTIPDGVYGGKLFNASNWNNNFAAYLSVGVGNYKMQFNAVDNILAFRTGGTSNLSNIPWKTIAFTDSNVASATKLQTTRSIWGQSFDGTGDVSGNLTLGYNPLLDGAGNRCILFSSGELYLGTLDISAYTTYITGNAIRFRSGSSSSTNMIIASSGNVLIGTTTDYGGKLQVNGILRFIDHNVHIAANGISGNWANTAIVTSGWMSGIDDFTEIGVPSYIANTASIRLIRNGNVGIGTTSPQYKLDVRGVIYSNTGIFSDGYVSAKGQNTSSDMRLKNVLNDVVLGVKDIANAPSMRFAWKNGGGIDVGSSAQYWQGLLPDAVKERDGMLEMQYANIALLSAISLAKNFETMDERVARLERENEELRNEINSLRYGA